MSISIAVGNKKVGYGEPNFIIAEIGNNHNGDFALAKKMVEAAALAGADAVKLQRRTVDEVFTKELLGKEQTHSKSLGTTYGAYRKKLELQDEEFAKLKDIAHSLGLVYFVTPFDLTSAKVLAEIGMDAWKIASFDVSHPELVEFVAKQGKPLFLSTGMSTLEDVDLAIKTVQKYNDKLILNQCVSIYPTTSEDLNLGAIKTLIDRYNPIPVGYSGHEMGYFPTIAAVALGACTVERHFTYDKTLPGPDQATVSLEPHEFAHMVKQIRIVEAAVRDDKKYIHEREIPLKNKHSKSVVSKTPIKAGTTITAHMLVFKSPGHGTKPSLVHTMIGRTAKVDIDDDVVILEEHLV